MPTAAPHSFPDSFLKYLWAPQVIQRFALLSPTPLSFSETTQCPPLPAEMTSHGEAPSSPAWIIPQEQQQGTMQKTLEEKKKNVTARSNRDKHKFCPDVSCWVFPDPNQICTSVSSTQRLLLCGETCGKRPSRMFPSKKHPDSRRA